MFLEWMNVNEQKSGPSERWHSTQCFVPQSQSITDTKKFNPSPYAYKKNSSKESNPSSRQEPLHPFLPHQLYVRNIKEEKA